MYEIWADDLLIYSDVTPLETVKVVSPKLTLADSAAGQLDMSLPPINVGYEVIKRMVTDITVKCDGEWLWSGRVLQDSYDFWNNRKMICEGEIAFLNDSIQPPAKYSATSEDPTTVRSFLEALIEQHNSQVGTNRQFVVGEVTVGDNDQQDDDDAINRYTNYETTLECINDKLLSRLKGHLRVRHVIENGVEVRKLDYISDDTLEGNIQVVRFGVNLLDFSKNIDMSELSTVIVPRGHRLEDESDVEIEGLEPYLTVKTLPEKSEEVEIDGTKVTQVWHDNGSLFVKNPTAIDNFGWICAVVDWDAVTVDENLYKKAVKYLKDEQYEKMTLEVKAVDLRYMGFDAHSIKFLSKLRCVSEPHGMDHTFIVSKMDIDLSNPANTTYTLGDDVKLSLTQATSKVNQAVKDQIDNLPSKSEILNAAKENAFQMLIGGTGGYVRFNRRSEALVDPITHQLIIDPNTGKPVNDGSKDNVIYEIIISDGPTDETSLYKWVWNQNGLGHMHRSSYSDDWTKSEYEVEGGVKLDVAITKDGKIVANAITAGYMNCDRLDGGTINGQKINGCVITSESGKKHLKIEGSDVELWGTDNSNAGYVRCYDGNKNGNFYEHEFGISSEKCHAAWDSGRSYMEVSSHYIIEVADYFRRHGGWD